MEPYRGIFRVSPKTALLQIRERLEKLNSGQANKCVLLEDSLFERHSDGTWSFEFTLQDVTGGGLTSTRFKSIMDEFDPMGFEILPHTDEKLIIVLYQVKILENQSSDSPLRIQMSEMRIEAMTEIPVLK